MLKKLSERQILYLMALVNVCYTAVLRLCSQEALAHSPERAALRSRLAALAHSLDWLMNLMVALVGVGRLFREESFGGQHQPRWLKIYFMAGPLPTIGMVGAMITGQRWSSRITRSTPGCWKRSASATYAAIRPTTTCCTRP